MHDMAAWQTGRTMAQAFLLMLQIKHRFDLVMVTERRAQESVAALSIKCFRYVAIIHGSEVLAYFGGNDKAIPVSQKKMLRFYRHAEKCIAVSEATLRLAQRLLGEGAVDLVAVKNGISPARYPAPDREETKKLAAQYGGGGGIVFSLGRLDLDKGQDVLITAFDKVRRKHPPARLLIGGDGPYMQKLRDLSESLSLDGHVRFLGAIPQSTLPSYFDLCDVFALTSKSESRWEGFGLVYLEAGLYGRAVIGGNEGGVPEAIEDGSSGLIVNPRDHEEVASAIMVLLGDKELRDRMGARGKSRVLEYFNADRMAGEIIGQLNAGVASSGMNGVASPVTGLVRWLLIGLPADFTNALIRQIRSWIPYVR